MWCILREIYGAAILTSLFGRLSHILLEFIINLPYIKANKQHHSFLTHLSTNISFCQSVAKNLYESSCSAVGLLEGSLFNITKITSFRSAEKDSGTYSSFILLAI